MTNIAIVILDTLRKDAFDKHFDWLPGIRFENTWSTAHYTIPAHASLLTGQYPSENAVHSKSEVLDCDCRLLTEHLIETGYRTRAISSNLLMSPLYGFDRGIDEFHFSGRAQTLNSDIYPWYEGVQESLRRDIVRDLRLITDCIVSDYDTIQSLKFGLKLKRDQFHGIEDTIDTVSSLDFGTNEFLLINTMEAHAPYEPPKEYRTTEYENQYIESRIKIDNRDDLTAERTAYEDSVRYLSDRYEVLFDKLRRDFDIIVSLSDHGELFGEYRTSRHYYGVVPELTHIPLCIYTRDGIEPDGHTHGPTSILDVHRTILEMVDVEAPSRGQDLFSDVSGGEYLVESLGVRTPLFRRLEQADFDDAYLARIDQPLRGIALPDDYYGFETPEGRFVESGNSTVNDPRTKLDALVETIDPSLNDDTTEQELTAGVETHLRELGYL